MWKLGWCRGRCRDRSSDRSAGSAHSDTQWEQSGFQEAASTDRTLLMDSVSGVCGSPVGLWLSRWAQSVRTGRMWLGLSCGGIPCEEAACNYWIIEEWRSWWPTWALHTHDHNNKHQYPPPSAAIHSAAPPPPLLRLWSGGWESHSHTLYNPLCAAVMLLKLWHWLTGGCSSKSSRSASTWEDSSFLSIYPRCTLILWQCEHITSGSDGKSEKCTENVGSGLLLNAAGDCPASGGVSTTREITCVLFTSTPSCFQVYIFIRRYSYSLTSRYRPHAHSPTRPHARCESSLFLLFLPDTFTWGAGRRNST